jgi:hypothetical protein
MRAARESVTHGLRPETGKPCLNAFALAPKASPVVRDA